MSEPYRALSLDLWFTTLSFEEGTAVAWRKAREQLLRDLLVLPGGPPTREQLRRASSEVRASDSGEGPWRETLDPAIYLERLAERLGGRLRGDAEEAGALYSDVGLLEAPPRVNPEAVEVVRRLSERGVPVLAITNTGRRERSWKRFFEASEDGPRFRAIVTSCEVGRGKPSPEIFRVGAERLGLPCSSILHVGDRWDIDIVGARAAGMGRALYRGLWDRYSEPEDLALNPKLDDGGEDVLRISRLTELLTEGRFLPGGEEAKTR